MSSETAAKPRRTQEERSATTRKALLDATIDCLAEDGYAALTTTRVAARAGVSRGAQVHHFPTKGALVAEAIGHLAERAAEEMIEATKDRPRPISVADTLDLLWESFRGPVFQAVIQFSAASPPEPEVRESLHTLDQAITRMVHDFGPVLFGESAREPGFEDAVFTAFNTMSGLALNYRVSQLDDALMTARWSRTKAQLLRLFDLP